MPSIKNIVFDLGAVLLDIDFNKVAQAFKELGIQDFEKQYSQLQAVDLFQQLEKGEVSPDDFYKAIQNQVNVPLHTDAIKNAWNAILCDFRKSSMEYLLSIKKEYRLFLLSNTNAIHLEAINSILFKQTSEPLLDNYFEKAYYSHKVGMRKPGEEIFFHVLNDANIVAHETIFIDDSLPNVEAARKIGFISHCLLPEERVEQLVPNQLLNSSM